MYKIEKYKTLLICKCRRETVVSWCCAKAGSVIVEQPGLDRFSKGAGGWRR